MIFDRNFFKAACLRFPEVMFHVIGAGPTAEGLSALLPAVCPRFAAGSRAEQIAYDPVDFATIQPAIAAVLNRGKGDQGEQSRAEEMWWIK